jgi:PAS domain S-box-containing protein
MGSSALFITLTYLVFGILWIAISGKLVLYFANGIELSSRFELYKGLFFILATSLLLYAAIRRRERQREKLEADITKSEVKWKNIFDSANDPILILDRDYKIIETNSKACDLYGYSPKEFQNLSIKDIHEYNDIEFIRRQMNEVINNTGSEFEINHRKKDGSIIPVEVSTRALMKDDGVEFIHIVHDLSARKNIEKKLISSESKYRTLVEASHELIWATDEKNVISFVNNASREIYGLAPEEMIGKKFTDFATREQIDLDLKAIKEAIKQGNVYLQYEGSITDSQGKEKYLLTNCIINKDSTGKLTGMFGTSLDITERYESGERVKYHNRIYSLMTNMNQLIVRAKNKEQILNDACRLAVEFGMFQLAWIGIVDGNSGKVLPAYQFGKYENYTGKLDISVKEPDNVKGPIVRAFTENVFYVSNDVENDYQLMKWKAATLEKGFRSFATFPIEVRNKVVAVYNIYSENKDFFGKTETELLLELTEDISFALEYIELENERLIIEDRYKNIVEKAPIGIFVHLDRKITYINPEGYSILGASTHKEIIGKDIFELIHPEYKEIVLNRLEKVQEGISASELEEKFTKSDGTVVEVMVSAIPYFHEGKKGAQVFFRDLTEQKKTQCEISETNERFKLITKATNDALWDWDLLTDNVWWNDGFKDLFGYNDDEIGEKIGSWEERIHENDRKKIISGLHSAISSGHDFWFDEYSFLKKDGNYAYVFDRAYILKDAGGKPYRMVGSMIDITFRRKMENELKESEEKWRSLFENSPSIIFTIDKQFAITGINRSFINRYNSEEIIGMNAFELIDTDEQKSVREIIERVFADKQAESFTVKSSESDHGRFYSVQAVPFIKNSAAEGMTLIATDITDKIMAEERLKETNQRLHALAAHLQTIREEERTMISREIHDQLGQELTALKMDIAFLSRQIDKVKLSGKPDWNELQDGLKSMSDITDQTINSVRRIARELRPDVLDKLGLKDAIEWQAEEFTKRTGIDCIVSISRSELNFNNLLENTVFRIVQESLTNVARHSGATRSKVGLSMDSNSIYLTIEDNGRGITPEEIDNAKSLGLVGIKERAYSVNGKLTINGQKDKGTILKIIIPIEQ